MSSTVRAWSTDAAGRGPSTQLWGRQAQPFTGQVWQDPNYGFTFWDDFQSFQTDVSNYDLTTDTTVAPSAVDVGGVLLLTTGATDNDEAVIRGGIGAGNFVKIGAGTGKVWFEARVRMSLLTDGGLFVGLVEEGGGAANTLVDDTCVLQDKDAVGFNIVSAAPTALTTVHNTAGGGGISTVDATLTNGTAVVDTWVKLGFRFDGNSVITFFVDGTPEDTTVLASATNFPDGEEMHVCLAAKTGAAASVVLGCDWIALAQEAV